MSYPRHSFDSCPFLLHSLIVLVLRSVVPIIVEDWY
jgi:hypothetical protein